MTGIVPWAKPENPMYARYFQASQMTLEARAVL
jgi:hypothetical protein